jgi:hypothetical protein
MDDAVAQPPRSGRFWLYAPFGMLLLVAVLWSVAWFVVRDRVAKGLDAILSAEARAGRQWTCQDRRIGGYPFRIEVTCASLTVRRDGVTAALGPMRSVAQVYQPRHVITEIDGPLDLTDGRVAVQGTWRLLETSVRGSRAGLQRASVVVENPSLRILGAEAEPIELSGELFEAHLRPNPNRPQERAFDAAVQARQARLPLLDGLLGGPEPANLQIDVTATQAEGFRGRPVVDEIERWRAAGGKLDVLQLSLEKGTRRIQARGELRLDDLHRPAGELAVAGAGLESVIARLTGNRVGGALLGALFGPRPSADGAAAPALTPLPPLRLDDGRLSVGPFVVPSVRLPALY